MSSTRSGGGPDDGDKGSWTSETLPMSLRKELLERELRKLGFRKTEAKGTAGHDAGSAQQQAQGGSHPQAGGNGGQAHGD